jgi:hypothetical protein
MDAVGLRRPGRSIPPAVWAPGLTIMVNSLFNGWRMDDVWFDK